MVNKSLAKMCGTPHNLSDGSGQRKTQAAGRPAIDKSIVGGYFTSQPNATKYGVAGVEGGGGQGGNVSQAGRARRAASPAGGDGPSAGGD